MAIPNTESSFICYNLTDTEIELGSILTYEQRCMIQNDIAVYAEEKVLLTYDVDKPVIQYAVYVAALDSKIELLKYLIARSDAATEAAKERAANSQF